MGGMRLSLSPEFSEWLKAEISDLASDTSEPLPAEGVNAAGALPLYRGWWETIGLRPDGEIVSWSTKGDYTGTRPVGERSVWLSALVHAAETWPELWLIVPPRPPHAIDCKHIPPVAEGKLFCSLCCGLGWIELQEPIRSATSGAPQTRPARNGNVHRLGKP